MESSPENSASGKKDVTTRSGRPRRRAARLSTSSPSKHLSKKEKKEESVSPVKGDCNVDADLSDFDDIDIKEDDDWDLPDDNSLLKLTDEDFQDDRSYDHLDLPAHDLELDNDDFEIDDEVVDSEDVSKDSSSGMAQSLYLSEKAGRAGSREGQRRRKAQRKDKGKSRFTAYMLWAREVRADISKKHPELDFSAVNKKLGELWQLVPTAQKYNWKRRAKRLAVRLRQGGASGAGKGASPLKAAVSPPARSSGQQLQGAVAEGGGGRQSGRRASPSKAAKVSSPQRAQRSGGGRSSQTRAPAATVDSAAPTGFKVTGTAAIDVASHMKLLGESLNNIGHKLKEHEGQIAVSGSLSVLLDSMLCVLGPLMCLTDQLEETRGAIKPETHAAILDNIAYIMPGIV